MQVRESGVLAFGLGLRRACEGAGVGAGEVRGWRWQDEAKGLLMWILAAAAAVGRPADWAALGRAV